MLMQLTVDSVVKAIRVVLQAVDSPVFRKITME